MGNKRVMICLLALAISAILPGCWDRVEIDERGFVVGVAIDKMEDESDESGQEQDPKFRVTYQIVIPSGLKASGPQGEASSNQAYFNMEVDDFTMSKLISDISAKTSRAPFLEHLKVIIISDNVARENGHFADTIDFYLRDSQMRRSVKVLVTKGKAKDVLEITPPNEKLPALYIDSVADNTNYSTGMLLKSKLGDIHELLLRKDTFLIQNITTTKNKNEVKILGAALFNNQSKLQGFLNEEEITGVNFITDKVKGGVIASKMNNYEVAMKIEKATRKITAESKDGKHFNFSINIEIGGVLSESFEVLNLLKENTMEEIEGEISNEVKRKTNSAITALQKKYRIDALGLEDFLYQHQYKQWEPIQDDWNEGENLFTQSTIEVNVTTKLRRTGSIINSKGD